MKCNEWSTSWKCECEANLTWIWCLNSPFIANVWQKLGTAQLLRIICCKCVTSTFVSHSHLQQIMPRDLQSNIQSVQVHLFVQHLQFNRLPLMEHFSFPLCFGLSFLMALLSFSSCPIIQKHWLIINHFSKPWLHQWYITWFGIEQKQID